MRGRAGTLPRTSRLGVHGPAAESSDRAFLVANRVAAPVVLAAAAIFVIGAVLTVALRLSTIATLVVFLVALVGALCLLIAGGTVGERAALAVPKPAARPTSCDGCVCGSGGCAGLTRNSAAAADA
jgi:hypothetical protein